MSKNVFRTKDAAELHARLKHLLQTMPAWEDIRSKELSQDDHMWLGRARALVSEVLGVADEMRFQTAQGRLKRDGPEELLSVVVAALAQVEMEVPPAAQGNF